MTAERLRLGKAHLDCKARHTGVNSAVAAIGAAIEAAKAAGGGTVYAPGGNG